MEKLDRLDYNDMKDYFFISEQEMNDMIKHTNKDFRIYAYNFKV